MNRDGPFRSRAPLTATEKASRAAVLKASQEPSGSLTAAVFTEMLDEAAAMVADTSALESTDAREYGPHAAQILSGCWRDVALAPKESKRSVFEEVAKRMGDAVAGQWLPKTVMMDRLQIIAETHRYFGLKPDQIQQLIADAAEAIRIPQTTPASAPLKRRLITHRASDLQPEKLVWVWPGRIPEGKLVLVGGPPGLGKSQLTAFMASTISNGGDWPCNEGSTAVGNVIFMSAEDGIEDTIVPRLMAAGANLDRVHIVASATNPDGTGSGLFQIERYAIAHGLLLWRLPRSCGCSQRFCARRQ